MRISAPHTKGAFPLAELPAYAVLLVGIAAVTTTPTTRHAGKRNAVLICLTVNVEKGSIDRQASGTGCVCFLGQSQDSEERGMECAGW